MYFKNFDPKRQTPTENALRPLPDYSSSERAVSATGAAAATLRSVLPTTEAEPSPATEGGGAEVAMSGQRQQRFRIHLFDTPQTNSTTKSTFSISDIRPVPKNTNVHSKCEAKNLLGETTQVVELGSLEKTEGKLGIRPEKKKSKHQPDSKEDPLQHLAGGQVQAKRVGLQRHLDGRHPLPQLAHVISQVHETSDGHGGQTQQNENAHNAERTLIN